MELTGVVGRGLFTITFAFFIGSGVSLDLPGAPFLVSALLMAAAFALAAKVTRNRRSTIMSLANVPIERTMPPAIPLTLAS